MEVNQFAWYQLKTTPENRLIRFRCYKELQEKKIPVRHENYGQVYLGRMKNGDRLLADEPLFGTEHRAKPATSCAAGIRGWPGGAA